MMGGVDLFKNFNGLRLGLKVLKFDQVKNV